MFAEIRVREEVKVCVGAEKQDGEDANGSASSVLCAVAGETERPRSP